MKKEQTNMNFVQMEHDLLKKWKDENLFENLVKKNQGGKRFRFLDGPITANNRSGVHHIWGRTLKDITIKSKAMQGCSCHYQNGFDAQGMWVEVNEEKSLGLNGKPEIVEYGLDKFTTKCMQRVSYYANEITNQSIRMGQFMDWDNSYYTNSDDNITAIWHFLKVCNEKGWIIKKNRPMAWCPRCGTSLSEHEMNGAYKDVTHTAIFVKLPVKDKDFKMIAWTTTPWTLSANVALAVNPNLDYALVQDNATQEKYVLGKERLSILKGEYTIIEEFKGEKLVGLEYETCFTNLSEQNFAHKIIPWEDVDSTEGSCVVHIAPGCGAEDFDLGLKFDLPQICPINEQGIMLDNTGFMAGYKTTDVTDIVVENLKEQNKLLYAHKYKHSYPFCWRCKTDLVYKLISTWFIKMDELRPQLVKALDEVEFQPEYSKKRMIDWLNNMGDWNISRSRFYGLPLPFYICEKCGKVHVIGSLEELKEKAINPQLVDKIPHLHRPYIDEVEIKCDCGETLKRIPEVGDCWLDAGITPFSTKKFFTDKKFFEENFPSDYVCEMVEQVKLWFFFTLVMSVTLMGKAPYKKVVTYQYVRDENGNEFHKSGGNSLDCDVVADKTSADAIRYLYASANPTLDMRFGYSLTDEVNRKLLGFWNTYTFFNTYAVLDNPDIANYKPNVEKMQIIDKWLLTRKDQFVQSSVENYNKNTYFNIVKDFEELVDDISNFYIRVNRKRFWKSNSEDQMDAYYTLYHTLKASLQIMAPIIPFVTDYIWTNLVCEIEKDEVKSVHLSNFPEIKENINLDLVDSINKARDIIYLAQKLRNENQIKVKQPLARMFLKCDESYKNAVEMLKQIVLDELNIKTIEYVADDGRFNTSTLFVNFKTAGQVLKGRVNELKTKLASLSEEEMEKIVNAFDNGQGIEIESFDKLAPTLFEKKLSPKQDFAVATINNTLVALDINLTQELIDEGNLREIIRQLQVSRKEANFEISDRIILDLTAEDENIDSLIKRNSETIKIEVLATEITNLSNADYETTCEVASTTLKIKMSVNK
ncbi:MAG: isoleucine--tRNA ligase [Clostridia bacterium]|nr:isoleucine--tRNA ligase [Clostridia bacterium]